MLIIATARAQTAPLVPPPDSRYKVDILVIVGHPDDDIEIAAYLAKAIKLYRLLARMGSRAAKHLLDFGYSKRSDAFDQATTQLT